VNQRERAVSTPGRLLLTLGVVLSLCLPAQVAMAAGEHTRHATFTLDSVPVAVSGAFLPRPTFVTSPAGNLEQVASSATVSPFEELTVVAVPFGTRSPAEGLPAASHGSAGSDLKRLAAHQRQLGGNPTAAPTITVFGRRSVGETSTIMSAVGPGGRKPTAIAEWVAEAGSRIWIIRASARLDAGKDQASFARSLAGLTLSSRSLSKPTTVVERPMGRAGAVPAATGDVPSWWNGSCNSGNHPGSFPLGASYLGMPACGPRPLAGGGDTLVQFFPGAWGEYEWECVELSMRFLYLTYGQAPYGANGNQVVANYPGTRLVTVWNGTTGQAPVPGDVISSGEDTQYGHTAVVSAGGVNASGDGSITVVEQNNSPGGSTTMSVQGWTVQGNPYPIKRWLHDPVGRSS
jgi:CHAP domain